MTTDTEALPPHPSHATVRDWMPVSEALRLADLWTVGDLDNSGQWRAAIKVLADETRAALAQRQQVPESEAMPCGHHPSLLLRSAETGETLYCELCDAQSGRRDAERRESELAEANAQLRATIAALRSEVEWLRKDAERYRWLRERLKVREERSMAGSYRDAIYVRVGQSFFDTPTRGSKGYLDPENYQRECVEFDAAVDAAIAQTKERA